MNKLLTLSILILGFTTSSTEARSLFMGLEPGKKDHIAAASHIIRHLDLSASTGEASGPAEIDGKKYTIQVHAGHGEAAKAIVQQMDESHTARTADRKKAYDDYKTKLKTMGESQDKQVLKAAAKGVKKLTKKKFRNKRGMVNHSVVKAHLAENKYEIKTHDAATGHYSFQHGDHEVHMTIKEIT